MNQFSLVQWSVIKQNDLDFCNWPIRVKCSFWQKSFESWFSGCVV